MVEFPTVPDDGPVFGGVDMGKLTEAMATQQVAFFERQSEETLQALGVRVAGYEADQERRQRILQLVSFYGRLGLRLVSVV